MPFKSQAQRGFMYAKHPRLANEFEAVTPPNAKLPEHVAKMADGGEVEQNPIAKMIDDLHEKFIRNQGDNGTFPKWEAGIKASSPTVKNPNERKGMKEEAGNYAGGGDVQPQPFGVGGQSGDGQSNMDALMSLIKSGGAAPAIPGMRGSLTQNLATDVGQAVGGSSNHRMIDPNNIPQPTQPLASSGPQMIDPNSVPPPEQPMAAPRGGTPSLSDTSAALNKAPDTNYDFYGNTGADQRAALYKQLLDQQRSPGNLIAQGIGGIGDAFSTLGGKSTNFQDQAQGIAAKNTENRIGSMDTQRQQKMQDMNANIEMQMNDPHSRIAKSMQATLKSAGLNVPAGMPPSVMLKVAGPLGELSFKQAQIEESRQYHGAEVANKRQGLAQQEWEYKTSHPILNAIGNAMDSSGSPKGAPPIGQPVKHASGAVVTKVK